MLSIEPRKYLTVRDISRLFHIKERTVYSLKERGLLRPVRVEGLRRVLFDAEDVRALIKK